MKFTVKENNYKLRKIKKSDVKDYYILGSKSASQPYIVDLPFKNKKEAMIHLRKMFFSKTAKQTAKGFAVIDIAKKQMIGIVEFHSYEAYTHSSELGYVIEDDYSNQGIMREAVKRIIDYGFVKLNYNAIHAKTFKDNPASIKILRKNHFKLLQIFSRTRVIKGIEEQLELYHFILERNEYFETKTKRDV